MRSPGAGCHRFGIPQPWYDRPSPTQYEWRVRKLSHPVHNKQIKAMDDTRRHTSDDAPRSTAGVWRALVVFAVLSVAAWWLTRARSLPDPASAAQRSIEPIAHHLPVRFEHVTAIADSGFKANHFIFGQFSPIERDQGESLDMIETQLAAYRDTHPKLRFTWTRRENVLPWPVTTYLPLWWPHAEGSQSDIATKRASTATVFEYDHAGKVSVYVAEDGTIRCFQFIPD